MKLMIRGFHSGSRFDLAEIRKTIQLPLVKSDNTFLLYLLNDTYTYIKNYGVIVFVNSSKEDTERILKQVSGESQFGEKQYSLIVDPSKDIDVNFDTICIPEYEPDLVHIISLNIAQSLALDHYQGEVDQLLEKSKDISLKLQRTGRISNSRKELSKFIGEIMNLRNRMADNLYIFESPPFAWKDKKLTDIDEQLNKELDVNNRFKAIQHSLNIVKENHEFFNDLLQHKHSTLLEWIIIILILFEVVHIFINN